MSTSNTDESTITANVWGTLKTFTDQLQQTQSVADLNDLAATAQHVHALFRFSLAKADKDLSDSQDDFGTVDAVLVAYFEPDIRLRRQGNDGEFQPILQEYSDLLTQIIGICGKMAWSDYEGRTWFSADNVVDEKIKPNLDQILTRFLQVSRPLKILVNGTKCDLDQAALMSHIAESQKTAESVWVHRSVLVARGLEAMRGSLIGTHEAQL